MSTLKVTKTASGKFTWTLYGQRNNAIAQAPEGGFASRQNLLRSLETARRELGAADIQDTTKTRGATSTGKGASNAVLARVAGTIVSRAKKVSAEAEHLAEEAATAISNTVAPAEKRSPAKRTAGTAAKRTRAAKKAATAAPAPVEEAASVPSAPAAPVKRTRARKAAKAPAR